MPRIILFSCLMAAATLSVRLVIEHFGMVKRESMTYTGAPMLIAPSVKPSNAASWQQLNHHGGRDRAIVNSMTVRNQQTSPPMQLLHLNETTDLEGNNADVTIPTHGYHAKAKFNDTAVMRQLGKKELKVCSPRGVASAKTKRILEAWRKMPKARNSLVNPRFATGSFRFAIIQDPLERLYSGYYSKCLHQRVNETNHCLGFSQASPQAPTFQQYLLHSRANPEHVTTNPYLTPMSQHCLLDQYDQVFHMSSPTFNHDVAALWLSLGAPPEVVNIEFPFNDTTQLYSNLTKEVFEGATVYDCELLVMAIPLLLEDYRGKYKEFFPFPEWARRLVNEPKCQDHLNQVKAVAAKRDDQTRMAENATSLRQLPVDKLRVCTPPKVASSAMGEIMWAWKKIPLASKSERDLKFQHSGSYSFALVRDPLERLYSGYYNKCLHQRESEPTQCPGFPNARLDPPSFHQFLEAAHRRPGAFFSNVHFYPMSIHCPLSKFDQVFHMSSPTFNRDVSQLWISLGAPPELVGFHFPVNDTRQLLSYYSNAAANVTSHYNCSTLILALPLLKIDYHGPYKDHFPFPEWALKLLKERECQKEIRGWNEKVKARARQHRPASDAGDNLEGDFKRVNDSQAFLTRESSDCVVSKQGLGC